MFILYSFLETIIEPPRKAYDKENNIYILILLYTIK